MAAMPVVPEVAGAEPVLVGELLLVFEADSEPDDDADVVSGMLGVVDDAEPAESLELLLW